MALSQTFLKLFPVFIRNYKELKGSLFRSADLNHNEIVHSLTETWKLISKDFSFFDSTIINYYNILALLNRENQPDFLTCWQNFLQLYLREMKLSFSFGTINCKENVEEHASEKLIQEYQTAYHSTKEAFNHAQQTHTTEVAMLKIQLEQFKKDNMTLQQKIVQLEKQVTHQKIFHQLQPDIKAAKEQLAACLDLLDNFAKITADQELITPSIVIESGQLVLSDSSVPPAPLLTPELPFPNPVGQPSSALSSSTELEIAPTFQNINSSSGFTNNRDRTKTISNKGKRKLEDTQSSIFFKPTKTFLEELKEATGKKKFDAHPTTSSQS